MQPIWELANQRTAQHPCGQFALTFAPLFFTPVTMGYEESNDLVDQISIGAPARWCPEKYCGYALTPFEYIRSCHWPVNWFKLPRQKGASTCPDCRQAVPQRDISRIHGLVVEVEKKTRVGSVGSTSTKLAKVSHHPTLRSKIQQNDIWCSSYSTLHRRSAKCFYK